MTNASDEGTDADMGQEGTGGGGEMKDANGESVAAATAAVGRKRKGKVRWELLLG